MGDTELRDLLIREHYVSAEDVAEAAKVVVPGHGSLVDELISRGLLTRELVDQAVAESFGVPYANLFTQPPAPEQLFVIPETSARASRIVLYKQEKGVVVVATDDPGRKELKVELAALFPKTKIIIAYAPAEQIDRAFSGYRKTLETRFSKIIEGKIRIAPELLDEIFADAAAFRASDIHFEPQGTTVLVRFRIDGVLHEAGRLPRSYYENVLNRIKVQSGLRMDEHTTAQDGSMRFEKDAASFDLRTSIVPTVEGEKIVLRVLATYVKGLSLADLGLSPVDHETIERASRKPFGMILVVGPTGSGKTTSLYALLKDLNTSDVNVTTIEDPVEYKLSGINQIQVNTETNLTFAKGLRSIVRQDPDVILVGEIRDQETADIAVNAALTGHLLLSTFHANDASTAVPRLLDMGAEPFLLASTLQLIVGQRLVRRICEHCRYSETIPARILNARFPAMARYFPGVSTTLYRGKGCRTCGNTGFRGRVAVFECITTTPELQSLILQAPSAQQIAELSRTQGGRTMFQDGIDKVRNGVTTLEELLRVVEPPSSPSPPVAANVVPVVTPSVSSKVAASSKRKNTT